MSATTCLRTTSTKVHCDCCGVDRWVDRKGNCTECDYMLTAFPAHHMKAGS